MEVGDELFGRYRLVRRIARGGMGTVWEAEDLRLSQPVALKHVDFTDLPEDQVEETRARTLREAKMAAQLRGHPHVVSIYDVIESDGDVWLVLEYLPSVSLDALPTGQDPLELNTIARIGAAVADALAAAHALGIVHRDVKPGNILIGTDRRTVKLTDFGISHALDERPITRANVISGTPAYMAREVARGEESTPASDIFSFGATLYRAIEGQPPFGDDPNTIRQLHRVATGPINPPARPTPLTGLVMRLLEFDPHTRPDAAATRDELHNFATRVCAPTQPSPSDRTDVAPLLDDGPPIVAAEPAGARRPESAPTPERHGRRRLLVTGIAGVAALAIIAGLVLSLPRLRGDDQPPVGNQPLVGAPRLPATVGPITLTGNPRDADPCRLIDLAWLRQFGKPVILTYGDVPSACRARITTQYGDVSLDVVFERPVPSMSALEGQRQQIGDLTVVRESLRPKGGVNLCRNTIVLADRHRIYVQIYDPKGPDPCAPVEVGTATAVNALARDGDITYRPGRLAGLKITDSDACDRLPPAALATVPGLDTTTRFPGFGNWSCTWGPDRKGSPKVFLSFRLDDGPVGDHDFPTTIAGSPGGAWTELESGEYNPQRCAVYVVTRLAPTATGANELLGVRFEGPQPGDELCARAKELATTAVANLPPA